MRMCCSVNSSAISRRGICYTSCCWGFTVQLQCSISGFHLWRTFPCSVSVSIVQAGSCHSHMTTQHLPVWAPSVGYCSSDCTPHATALRKVVDCITSEHDQLLLTRYGSSSICSSTLLYFHVILSHVCFHCAWGSSLSSGPRPLALFHFSPLLYRLQWAIDLL